MQCPKCGGSGQVDDPRQTGADARRRRLAVGLSLRGVAQTMGFSPSYLSDLELGKRAWNAYLTSQYAKALQT